jgi:hypothetical protein
MTHWTLKVGSVEQSLAEWGFEAATLTRQNQEIDSLTFAAGAIAFDADPILDVGDTAELWRDRTLTDGAGSGGTRVFVGEVVSVPVFASATTEGQSYLLHNAWAALDELLYEQTWYLAVDPDNLDESLVGGRQSHVVLFQGINGSKLTLGEQVTDIAAVAIDLDVSMQMSTADVAALTLTPPYDEQRDLTLAEALRRCLRWIPDAVTWWDYATTPPTLHIQRRATLPTVTMPVVSTDAQLVESAQLRARPDLQAPAVVLKYERVNTVDGVPWRQLVKDIYPVGADEAARGNVVATIDLDGDQVQRSVATIVTRNLARTDRGGHPGTLDFWSVRDPEVAGATTVDFGDGSWVTTRDDGTVVTPSELVDAGLVNELVSGQIAPWMLGAGDVVESVQVTKRVILTTPTQVAPVYESWDGVRKGQGHQCSARVVATSLTSGTYTTTSTVSTGEDVPTGLAQRIYEAVSVLQYEGTVTWVAEECPAVGFGLLNLTGGRAAWESMAALIQGVSLEIETGRTTVTFGPPAHLGPTDLVELLRFNRGRRVTFNWSARTSGRQPEAGALGSHVGAGDTVPATAGTVYSDLLLDAGDDSGRQVLALAKGLVNEGIAPDDKVARFREVTVPVDGIPQRMMILAQFLPPLP